MSYTEKQKQKLLYLTFFFLGDIPEETLTFNGETLTFDGEPLTYTSED